MMEKVRRGFGTSPFNHHTVKRANPSCQTGGFYKSPSNGASVDVANSLNITWDTSCLTADALDIYLYNPANATSRIHMWDTVKNSDGHYEATLDPSWWGGSQKSTLQLSIVEHNSQPFLSPFPAGPVITATSSGSSSSKSSSETVTHVYGLGKPSSGLSPGKKAAAVIMPLLIVFGLLAAAYLKIKRARNAEKRKRWSEAVDKRMSTISTDWKSMSAAGASAAIRQSMAGSFGASRTSFAFGQIRPNSGVDADGGQAGVGARGMYSQENVTVNTTGVPQMRMRNSSFGSGATGERVSRVSFADDPRRPSGESRRTVASRKFHQGHVPPLPTRSDSDLPMRASSFYDANAAVGLAPGEMSPVQRDGAMEISADEIRARISGEAQEAKRVSVMDGDDVMPALNMMRDGDELMFPAPPTPLTPPTPVHAAPTSPVVGMMPMQPTANMMSPDDMLRAYACRSPGAPSSNTGEAIPFPSPALTYNGNGMRTLYSPTTPVSAAGGAAANLMPHSNSAANPYRMQWEEDDEQSAYGGTA